MTRREFAAALSALTLNPPKDDRHRFAICHEIFEGLNFAAACRAAARTGYYGIEIAPASLASDPTAIDSSVRAEMRRIIEESGLEFVGLHHLLASPPGLHATTPDPAVRNNTWDHLNRLIELCSDLGDGGLLVFASGSQRSAEDPAGIPDARKRLEEGLRKLGESAAAAGVTVILEPLPSHLSNVVTTLDEAAAMVRRIRLESVQTMFDTHNAVQETAPHGDLIRKHCGAIHHVHLNEMDGRHPGTGSYDFAQVLRALKDCNYKGWLSIEVFDFKPNGQTVAAESMRVLQQIESSLSGARGSSR